MHSNIVIGEDRLPRMLKTFLGRVMPLTSCRRSPARRSPARRSPARRSPARRSPTRSSPTRSSPAVLMHVSSHHTSPFAHPNDISTIIWPGYSSFPLSTPPASHSNIPSPANSTSLATPSNYENDNAEIVSSAGSNTIQISSDSVSPPIPCPQTEVLLALTNALRGPDIRGYDVYIQSITAFHVFFFRICISLRVALSQY